MSSERPTTNGCGTCYGTGEVVDDGGAGVCPDCLGHGRTPRGEVMEWRLRDIERAHAGHTTGCEADVRWLVFELRRHRDALLRIFTRCEGIDDVGAELRHVANSALDIYAVEERE